MNEQDKKAMADKINSLADASAGERYIYGCGWCDAIAYKSDEPNMPQLSCLADIREVVGDPAGKMMQDDLVEKIRADYARLAALERELAEVRASNSVMKAGLEVIAGKETVYAKAGEPSICVKARQIATGTLASAASSKEADA